MSFGTQSPDWAALAEQADARKRRRKWLWTGGGVVATAAVVATVIVTAGGTEGRGAAASDLPSPKELPGRSAQPAPSFSSVAPPPPPDPKEFISSAGKDTAPLSADTLFPGHSLTMGDRVYTKGPTAGTTDCAAATEGALGPVLTRNGCDRMFRATYTKDGVAVTVGVAVFESAAQAARAKEEAVGGIAPLSGAGVPSFCHSTVCRRTANSVGRYTYFTYAGFTSGKRVTEADRGVFGAGDDLAEFAFRQIYARGQQQASAAADAGR
ncbi:hypothetical protein GCM10020367_38310 [Streptomyces sannanensis]|uniref:Tat pathway signal protein n=1 Tax=Streptomyces sannanensis TaxID=285536 RepID=A0ABP6SE43_9ACTN